MASPLEDKRICVTGGGGFLGRRVIERLLDRGYDTTAIRHSEYDLVRGEDVERFYLEMKPHVVIHLAAANMFRLILATSVWRK